MAARAARVSRDRPPPSCLGREHLGLVQFPDLGADRPAEAKRTRIESRAKKDDLSAVGCGEEPVIEDAGANDRVTGRPLLLVGWLCRQSRYRLWSGQGS